MQAFTWLLRRNVVTFIAFVLVLLLAFLAAFAPWLAPYDPLATDVLAVLEPPSAKHWFGTDSLGRDIFSRVIVATRLDIAIALSAVALSAAAGVAAGAASGYAGGWIDNVCCRFIDVLMAFPLFVAAMALVAVLGNSVKSIVLATAIINFPFYFRLIRAEIMARRSIGYVEAATITGNGPAGVVFRFLIPNSLPPVIVQMSLNLGWAILNTAGLAFIGLGVAPPTPEWGIMIQEGAGLMMSGEWWVVTFPGLALVISVFAFSLLGDGVRDLVDPRRRNA
ncbi:ABC transporter permease [Camelimonas abortus]|uniref:ABC transporter permease n=1 Tax=Camelimonas abortus TaxID=1017184 RepID=A0ABV7LAU8_9HYPH